MKGLAPMCLGAGHEQFMISNFNLVFESMSPTEIDLFSIVHVKIDFILLQKMYVNPSY